MFLSLKVLSIFFLLLKKYFRAPEEGGITCQHFFLGVKSGRKADVCEFFRDQPLGRNTCSSIVKKVCSKLGIRGCGESSTMAAHGSRATMISMLISAGYSDAAVVLRTGHRDTTSLQSYQNLRGRHGREQLEAVFGMNQNRIGTNSPAKRNIEVDIVLPSNDDDEPKRAKRGRVNIGGIKATNCTFNINYTS